MNAFLQGFGSIVPLSYIKIFDENEMELLMCGIQNIDVKDWKENTHYKGDYSPNNIVIQWFWRVCTFELTYIFVWNIKYINIKIISIKHILICKFHINRSVWHLQMLASKNNFLWIYSKMSVVRDENGEVL